MRLLRRGLTNSEKDAALALIRHLQSVYAYQQLARERYNDALVAAGLGTRGSELSHRSATGQTTRSTVSEFVMPAWALKDAVLAHMQDTHVAFGKPTARSLQPAYEDGSNLLRTMRTRAEAQRAGWEAWLADSRSSNVDTTEFARSEVEALDKSIGSLNALIKSVGLTPDAWLDLNCDAFNTVRRFAGLGALSKGDFRARFVAGQASGSARFFSD
jgi:hypothetical protein